MRDIEDLHVIGGSMEPVISKNETVFLEKGCLDVVPGDIISYQTGCKTKIVAHRLIRKQKIGTRLYFLQCPENGHSAGVVPAHRYLGKVWLDEKKKNLPNYQWRPITKAENDLANAALAKYLFRKVARRVYHRLKDRIPFLP